MKENGKTNNKTKDKTNSNGSGPMLKFNHIKRETLPQTRIDVRALEMVQRLSAVCQRTHGSRAAHRRGPRTVHHQHVERMNRLSHQE